MKISASVYGNENRPLEEVVHELELFGIDYLHFDCNDDPGVFDDIARIRSQTTLPIDVHLIVADAEPYFELLDTHHVEVAAIQYEALDTNLTLPQNLQTRLGIAIQSDTPIETFDRFRDDCSFVLFMTTTPGKSGGTFDQNTFQRIRNFRERYPFKRVHVDGGVDENVSFILRSLGVHLAVSGSFLLRAPEISSALFRLRRQEVETDWRVGEFMMLPSELPILEESEARSLESVLRTIGHFQMGFCIVVDGKGLLKGIVADGDVRRLLLRHLKEGGPLEAEPAINRSPITIGLDDTVEDMFAAVKKHARPIVFLPVLGAGGRLEGAVSFSNLVKGEH